MIPHTKNKAYSAFACLSRELNAGKDRDTTKATCKLALCHEWLTRPCKLVATAVNGGNFL